MQLVISGTIANYQVVNPKAKTLFIILHGWGQNANHWLEVAKLLSPQYQYLLLDLPGFGNSQHLLMEHPSVPDYTIFLVHFIKKLKLSRPILLGHSFGGQIALDFAIKYPQALSKLILVSPAGIRRLTKKQLVKRRIYRFLKPIKSLLPSFLQSKLRYFFTSSDYAVALGKHKEILKQIIKYDLTPDLSAIHTPTYILWGDLDTAIPNRGKEMTDLIPDSRLFILYGADHHPHLFKRELLSKTINRLLTKYD